MSRVITSIDQRGDATVVRLAGKIDMSRSPDLHKAMLDLCEQKPAHVVLQLAAVSYLDSSGVGTLVEVARRVKAYSGKLTLVAPNDRVRSIFEVTRLDRFFNIAATEEEVLPQ
ncbi:MAG: Anti-sigma-B factor antagonist [Phycisphaerae bacterium]|nr:STAS domain-containing protein [Planctomycetia bacterium]MCG3130440.1 Anti-sigma-B factor antagonist [Phycisphaerae bacterium]MCK6465882.1 STAS domain-containing protein [Phycisphaerae bacterium]MCL4719570.1 STAS domain-containing protein [Phycisphaerae bacterium]NUQ09422.1 STAS domain-containing protein [Phycisphaerae bacterium]